MAALFDVDDHLTSCSRRWWWLYPYSTRHIAPSALLDTMAQTIGPAYTHRFISPKVRYLDVLVLPVRQTPPWVALSTSRLPAVGIQSPQQSRLVPMLGAKSPFPAHLLTGPWVSWSKISECTKEVNRLVLEIYVLPLRGTGHRPVSQEVWSELSRTATPPRSSSQRTGIFSDGPAHSTGNRTRTWHTLSPQ